MSQLPKNWPLSATVQTKLVSSMAVTLGVKLALSRKGSNETHFENGNDLRVDADDICPSPSSSKENHVENGSALAVLRSWRLPGCLGGSMWKRSLKSDAPYVFSVCDGFDSTSSWDRVPCLSLLVIGLRRRSLINRFRRLLVGVALSLGLSGPDLFRSDVSFSVCI